MILLLRIGALFGAASVAFIALAGVATGGAAFDDRQQIALSLIAIALMVIATYADELTTAFREYWK